MADPIIELNSYIEGAASVVGKNESEGPLGACFDMRCADDYFGEKTWEKAESEMQRRAFALALKKSKAELCDIGALFAGDLLNQCTASAYGLLEYRVPFFGLYGACSTSVEGLILASVYRSAGCAKRTAVTVSSHYCSAERQFRSPVEYGAQRSPTAQWTVTGAGAFILGDNGKAVIRAALPGRVIDKGINYASNMGAAMAPAAADTLARFFNESGSLPSDYDLIVTGDLGYEGGAILCDLMLSSGYDIRNNYTDCGMLIYSRSNDDKHAGGSGCGCAATVSASYLLPKIESGELGNILLMATGAMMSPMSVMQGQSIPAIAHLVNIRTAR